MKEKAEKYASKTITFSNYSYAEAYNETKEAYEEGYKEGLNEAFRWIPVSECLPVLGKNHRVLVKRSETEPFPVIKVIFIDDQGDIEFLKSYTHWRPIEQEDL